MSPELIALLSNSIIALTAVIVPVVIGAGKSLVTKIPGYLIPLLAIGLGAAIDALNVYVVGGGLGGAWGAVLGALGIAVREVFVSIKGATNAA